VLFSGGLARRRALGRRGRGLGRLGGLRWLYWRDDTTQSVRVGAAPDAVGLGVLDGRGGARRADA